MGVVLFCRELDFIRCFFLPNVPHWEDYVGFYNMVDWSSIIVGSLAIGYYFQSRIAASAVNELLPSMIDASLKPDANYQSTVKEFFRAAEDMSKASHGVEQGGRRWKECSKKCI